MTQGFAADLIAQGVHVGPPRDWRLEWVCFRQHPCYYEPGIQMYRDMIRAGEPIEPPVLCSRCYTILDGWHRVAAHWLEDKRDITVRFADQHWMNGVERCYVDMTNHIETLRPWAEMDCISGAYHQKDWELPLFRRLRDELVALGENMPLMRYWEQARALMFLGNVAHRDVLDVEDLQMLDVGTRESLLPHYLARKGATVVSIDVDTSHFRADVAAPRERLTVERADATAMPFPDNSFDRVVSTACIKHIPERHDRRAVREMMRVCKPGGLVALTFDFGQEYMPYPSKATGRRVYDKRTVYSRLVHAAGVEPLRPDFDRADWNDWPIRSQAPLVAEAGYNIQVGFLLFRKPE